MTIIIIKIAVFLLGMCISVQVIAALHGFIDLWYTIKTAYPRVIRNILVWVTIASAVVWLLASRYQPVFLFGLVAYIVFYFGTYLVQKVIVIRNVRLVNRP